MKINCNLTQKEIQVLLADIKEKGCCKMADQRCIVSALDENEDYEAARYIESLSSEKYSYLVRKVGYQAIKVLATNHQVKVNGFEDVLGLAKESSPLDRVVLT